MLQGMLRNMGVVVGALLLMAGPALAFGTIRGLGQNAEHERITRHALTCTSGWDQGCFEPKTLTELAGANDNFGAVGIPDRGDLIPENKAHCDSGDYLDIPGYPHSKADAQAALENCRTWMVENLNEAVSDAGKLVDSSGHLRKSQLSIPCVFVGRIKGGAKCNVIEDMGLLLHASQDFYAHSNWVDRPDPSLPVGVENPPGLGNTGPAPWIDLGRTAAFPDGLITGCFENLPEKSHCNYGPGGTLHRVKHAVVNKDDGQIDPTLGAGTTQRGAIDDNFARAVSAAIDDTKNKWALLKSRLESTYGQEIGDRMACAISRDDPVAECK
jgi:hypothetical protein